MTRFAEKSFSVALGSKNFRSNWDAAFPPRCEYTDTPCPEVNTPECDCKPCKKYRSSRKERDK